MLCCQAGPRPSVSCSRAAGEDDVVPLLGIDARKLKADAEMRKIFGSKVVDAEDREQGLNVAGALGWSASAS
jgi:hypothetical protein